MSTELITARKKISSVGTLLKQKRHMPAVQSLHDALIMVLKHTLMRSERDEFERMIAQAVDTLNNDKGLRQLYPLIIRYNPGKEKELLEAMRELLVELQRVVTENAQQDLAEIERRKQEGLQKGQELIDRGEYDEARRVFDQLVGEFQSDTDLKADIADRFLKVERYEDALVYLEEALRHDPNAIYLYNRIGIVLRKMRDFETAEKYYKKALEISAQDEYLHFNIGRLYIDWQKWDKVREAAEKALKVNPEFAEAHKMLAFASRKLGG